MLDFEHIEPKNCTITIYEESTLLDALEDENPDIQALAAFLLTEFINEVVSKEEKSQPDPCIDKFFDHIIAQPKSQSVTLLVASKLSEANCTWIYEYLAERFRRIHNEKVIPKIAASYAVLSKLRVINPYQAIPGIIENLDDESEMVRKGALEVIGRLEASGDESTSDFIRSSYEWNVRSFTLIKKRWLSIANILAAMLYIFAAGSIAFSVLPMEGQEALVTGTIYWIAFMLVSLGFAIFIFRAIDTEKKIERRLRIPYTYLVNRKDMRKQIQEYFIKLLEDKHERWRNILTVLIRLYAAIALPSVIAIFLGRVIIVNLEWLLLGITVAFLFLALTVYKKMQAIERELIKKQKALRDYYI